VFGCTGEKVHVRVRSHVHRGVAQTRLKHLQIVTVLREERVTEVTERVER